MTTTDVAAHYVRANGIDIHYTEIGAGEPVVLLHGGLVSTNPLWDRTPISFGSFLPSLAERFRVIAPDTRGSGRTIHRGGSVSFSTLADDVAALIGELDLDRPTVCGFSEGGTTATVVGIRHPGSVRAIVNDAGHDLLNPDSHSFPIMRQMLGGAPDATSGDPDAAALFFETSGMGSFFDMMVADQDGAQGTGHWREYLRQAFERTAHWPGYAYDDLRSITVPTLVVFGDRDDFCTAEDGVATFRALPNGELSVVPNTGHAITADVMAVIDRFLDRHAG
ncbi:alpha/beta fold hydrolase [Antrihabitans stalactiti]|uniref:Alpha/beta hydrolase n=1 Tax=Antrihabitans stalactiti TaxID=2584121 RepID=A0A848KKD3_9NOCA|nr:alpha/beta hydrolase [Antrihabitans stalactiti]NMN98328.1 alpha/beta hydrolase [Antrihabitans stalactiti]